MKHLYEHKNYHSLSKNKELDTLRTNDIKHRIHNLLIDKQIISDTHIHLESSDEYYRNFLQKLYSKKLINNDDFIAYWTKLWWKIKLWTALMYHEIITKKQFKQAILTQEEEKRQDQENYRNLWTILLEDGYISEEHIEKFYEVLRGLNIIKLWEYVISKKLIAPRSLEEYLKYWKEKNITLWKVLVEKGIINQTQLNHILHKLNMKIDINELSIDFEH